MPRESFYDVIVVGGEPSVLMAAGLLRRQNYRVLLLGQGKTDPTYSHDRLRIPALPALLPPYGHAPELDNVLKSLGIEDRVHTLGIGEGAPLQVIMPEHRITLHPDLPALTSELKRELPQESNATLGMLGTLRDAGERLAEAMRSHPPLQPLGLRDRARQKRLERNLQAHDLPPVSAWPLLLRILAASTSFFSRLDHLTRPGHTTAHLVLALLGGLRTVPDYSQRLLEAIRKAGVDVEPRMMAEEILFEGKTITGVTTLRSSAMFRCGLIIAGVPIRETLELVPLKLRHRKFRLAADTVRPARSVFVVNFVLPRESLPLGMNPHLVLVRRPHEPLEEDNLLKIQCLPFPDRPDRVILSAGCLVPYRKRSLGREYLGPLHQSVLQAVTWLVPFLQNHLQGQSSPFWEARAGDEGHPSPWSIHQVYEAEQTRSLGSGLVPLQTPYRNLLYCGPEAMPGLGAEGCAHAATEAVRLVSEKRKLKNVI